MRELVRDEGIAVGVLRMIWGYITTVLLPPRPSDTAIDPQPGLPASKGRLQFAPVGVRDGRRLRACGVPGVYAPRGG